MLQALIVTLREGVEAALIVGITLAYLSKIGRPELRRVVYAALGAAFLCSIGVAIVLSRTQFNQDIFEGWVMLVAAFFVITMIWFMSRAAKRLKGDIEGKVGGLASGGRISGLFLFVFLMVLREGVETVLILTAVEFNSTQLLSFMGTLIGVLLAVVFGVMFVKGSIRINLQRFFRVTTVILIFVAAQLLVSGLHELSENGVLPSSREEMALIGPIVRNDLFFFVTILALAALMILFDQRRRQGDGGTPAPPSSSGGTNSRALQRKALWSARKEKLWSTAVYISSFVFIVLVTAEFIYAKSTTSLSPAHELTFVGGQVTISISEVSDGELHRYSANLEGKEVRFLIFKKPDGKVVTVLDACQICGPVGFYKSGNQIICKNCSAPINAQSMGQAGGCNPIPLKSSINGDQITISQADLSSDAASSAK
ncbi:MAG TPA: Fe-S-containing protein [Terriglobales bacterium]|nr:Fe-S-containing protein [Terriglobales bacterium]